MGRLDQGIVEALVEGLAEGCRNNECVLLGGETAEMPDFYAPGEYDLAGFIVGMVDEDARPGAHRVHAGDVLIGFESSGFHTNGYSLLRSLFFERLGMSIDDRYPGSDDTLADVLLRPHRSYAPTLLPLIANGRVRALSHITGGGIPENLVRVLPDGVGARIDAASWTVPQEFATVQHLGKVESDEMFLTFNMGVGMIIVVAHEAADRVLAELRTGGEPAWVMGAVEAGAREVTIA
jgi:phosphoribosylformylglycinamidine cyclo-ligase